MYYKPKHTYGDKPALHYKKIIDMTKYLDSQTHYYLPKDDNGGFYNYVYDKQLEDFVDCQTDYLNGYGVAIDGFSTYQFGSNYFYYDFLEYKWVKITNTQQITERIIELVDGNIYNGQKNRYIRNREFDYVTISDINETEEQVIKGLITPTKSFDIKYTDDDIHIKDDDIVQIDNELFMVSESKSKIIRLPKPYKTYFCTLTRLKR